MSKRLNWLGALVCMLVLYGCNDKVKQCNQLIEAANAQRAEITSFLPGIARADATQLDQLSGSLESLNRRIGAMTFKDQQLNGLASQYRSSIAGFAAAIRTMANVRRTNPIGALGAVTAVTTSATQVNNVAQQINAYCQAR